jgi:hypothetical protein
VLEEYFLENRARLLDLAAFLDRIQLCADAEEAARDPRLKALLAAIQVLDRPGIGHDRALQAQLCFSDPTTEPIASAAGMKGAKGAWMGGAP